MEVQVVEVPVQIWRPFAGWPLLRVASVRVLIRAANPPCLCDLTRLAHV